MDWSEVYKAYHISPQVVVCLFVCLSFGAVCACVRWCACWGAGKACVRVPRWPAECVIVRECGIVRGPLQRTASHCITLERAGKCAGGGIFLMV